MTSIISRDVGAAPRTPVAVLNPAGGQAG